MHAQVELLLKAFEAGKVLTERQIHEAPFWCSNHTGRISDLRKILGPRGYTIICDMRKVESGKRVGFYRLQKLGGICKAINQKSVVAATKKNITPLSKAKEPEGAFLSDAVVRTSASPVRYVDYRCPTCSTVRSFSEFVEKPRCEKCNYREIMERVK